MRLSYKYRLYPTKKQETLLNKHIESCRFLYNNILGYRKNAWEKEKKSITKFDSYKLVASFKNTYPELKVLSSAVCRNVCDRIDFGFQAFFRRLKSGDVAGFPRFRGKHRYNSFCNKAYGAGVKITNANKLYLLGIGDVYMEYHRDITGTPKTVTISKSSTNKWYASISCENSIPTKSFEKTNNSCGIDVGITSFLTLNTGEKIENKRHFQRKQKEISRLNKKIKPGIKNEKLKKSIARVYEHLTNKRHDFLHKTSNYLLTNYDSIFMEDLKIVKLIDKNILNKQIHDVAWRIFTNILSYKAEYADKKVVKINPAYTSQICSNCHEITVMPLSARTYKCACGLSIDRDVNAAKNILRLGIQSLE